MNTTPRPASRYLNVILTVNAALLSILAVNGLTRSAADGVPGIESAAFGQPATYRGNPGDNVPTGGGLTSDLEQRQIMIAEMRQMSTRIEHIDSLMTKGLNVKVVELPAAFMKSMEARDRDNAKKEPAKDNAAPNPGANIDKK